MGSIQRFFNEKEQREANWNGGYFRDLGGEKYGNISLWGLLKLITNPDAFKNSNLLETKIKGDNKCVVGSEDDPFTPDEEYSEDKTIGKYGHLPNNEKERGEIAECLQTKKADTAR